MKSIRRGTGQLRSKTLAACMVGAMVFGALSLSAGPALGHDGEDHEAGGGAAATC